MVAIIELGSTVHLGLLFCNGWSQTLCYLNSKAPEMEHAYHTWGTHISYLLECSFEVLDGATLAEDFHQSDSFALHLVTSAPSQGHTHTITTAKKEKKESRILQLSGS